LLAAPRYDYAIFDEDTMSDDDSARLLAALEELRTQANALSTRISANHDPRLRYTGEDRDGLARVTVDGHGRPTDLVVARNWRQQAEPARLARALVDATSEAQTRCLEAWAAGGGAPTTTALLDPARATEEPLSGASGPELIRGLLPMLDAAERQLDAARLQLEKHFTEKTRMHSPGRELTITTQGGRLTEIEFDDRWVASASAEEVANCVCERLQEAHDRAWTGIGDLLPRELSDLMSFAADPERMLRQLGLHT
jgi:hypothetical protein